MVLCSSETRSNCNESVSGKRLSTATSPKMTRQICSPPNFEPCQHPFQTARKYAGSAGRPLRGGIMRLSRLSSTVSWPFRFGIHPPQSSADSRECQNPQTSLGSASSGGPDYTAFMPILSAVAESCLSCHFGYTARNAPFLETQKTTGVPLPGAS